MLGTIVNTLAIIVGSLLGIVFRGGIPNKYQVTIMQAISLAVILIGLKMALSTDAILLVIFSLVIGSLFGEFLKIEHRLENLGKRLESKFAKAGDGFAKGFVVASLVFCVGSMAIVGSMESGLTGNHQTLFAKSALDGLSSVIFASTFGRIVFLDFRVRIPRVYHPDRIIDEAVSSSTGNQSNVRRRRSIDHGHRL